jgi:hypothetical protein
VGVLSNGRFSLEQIYALLNQTARHKCSERIFTEDSSIRAQRPRMIAPGDPMRIVAFNTLEHWSEDVAGYIATEIQTAAISKGSPLRNQSAILSSAT